MDKGSRLCKPPRYDVRRKGCGVVEHRHSSSRHRPESRWRSLLRIYRVELAWLLLVLLGIFLLFERLSIRSSIVRWLHSLLSLTFHAAGHVDDALGALLSRLTLSDAIGMLFIVGAATGIIMRVRWRLMRSTTLTAVRCPECAGELHRIHRHGLDRLISIFVPVRRYRCASKGCSWSGLRVQTSSGQHSGGHKQS